MIRILLVLCAVFFSACGLAAGKPIPMPADTKLVVFPYDPNDTYTILARPNNVTNLVLHPEEEIVAMALGDTHQWMVSEAPGHIFIKPLHPDIVTSGTLITTKRSYQLSLRSSPEDGVFYQRVSWNYPDMLILKAKEQQANANRIKQIVDTERDRLAATVVSKDISIETLNFSYKAEGEAEWKPKQVFDDGKFTWIRLGKSQDIPAVFALDEEDKPTLVNTNIRGEYLVIQRVLPKILLKLGSSEVRLTNEKREKSGHFFSGFGG